MKNLMNCNVQDLNYHELIVIDGGTVPGLPQAEKVGGFLLGAAAVAFGQGIVEALEAGAEYAWSFFKD
ncbi:MAG: hypothetical protein AB4372_09595 [Xenococcus sp. (in: cyanobacteria)]